MSRSLALVAVGVVAFACAPAPERRAPLVEAGEPALALPHIAEGEWFTDPFEPYPNCTNGPDPDRVERMLLEEAIVTDNLGPPPFPLPPDEYREPEQIPVDRRWHEAQLRFRQYHENGGNKDSQRAMALGLAWLARQQKNDGGWEFDGPARDDRVGATALAVLAYLRAGHTHRYPSDREESKFRKTVNAGFIYLFSKFVTSGPDRGRASTSMTAHAVAALALAEAYDRTRDPILRQYAQAAVTYIQKMQTRGGGWGEHYDDAADLATSAWVIQALHAARTAELVVDPRVFKKAGAFLDSLAGNARKSSYGTFDRTDANPGTTATATGLLCRYLIDGWRGDHPGMIDGVAGLAKNPPATNRDPVYLYYATRVLGMYEGEEWKTWNEGPKGADGVRKNGVRDILVDSQTKKVDDVPTLGSWPATTGRLRATCLALLTLETYYPAPASRKGGP